MQQLLMLLSVDDDDDADVACRSRRSAVCSAAVNCIAL